MDETYGTYVDDECFDMYDYDDGTDHDTDDDTDDDTIVMTILMMILMMVGAGIENRSWEEPNSYLR